MTGEEALGILGLTRPDSEAVRAAYLRLIRIHKPDTDPEGFRRVRSAYEVLTRLTALSGRSGPLLRLLREQPRGPGRSRSAAPIQSAPKPVAGNARPVGSSLAGALASIQSAVSRSSAAEIEARIEQLPSPSLDEPSPERTLQALHALLGGLLAAGHRRAASVMLSRFMSWLTVHGPTGRDAIGFRTAWAVRAELVQLHRKFPTRWVQRLAEASEKGEYASALDELSRRSLRTLPERLEARIHLPRSGFLHQLLSGHLGVRGRPFGGNFERLWAASGLFAWAVMIFVLFSVGVGGSGLRACPELGPSTGGGLSYASEEELNSSFGAAQAEILRYCDQDSRTAECVRAVNTLDQLAWGQCPRASADLGFLPSAHWVSLHETARMRCVALLGRKEGENTPKLAYRSESEKAAAGLCSLADQGGERWWCEHAQTIISELKAEHCPTAQKVLADFRVRLEAAPPASPFDRAVAWDLARAQDAVVRHCGDGP